VAVVTWLADMLTTLLGGRAECEYRRLCRTRPNLSDKEFYEAFYLHSTIPLETCVRVRRVLKTQLRMSNIRPDDNVTTIFDDIDLRDLCLELGDEFGVTFPDEVINELDGTIDSLIRATERLRILTAQGKDRAST
jgi:hypothetical protein